MKKFIKKSVSISLVLAGIVAATGFTSFAATISEKQLAADIQKDIMKYYHTDSTSKKIKKVKSQIRENEGYINSLERSIAVLEANIQEKIEECEDMREEINDCPYYNCKKCDKLSSKIKYVRKSIENLRAEVKVKEKRLKIAKEKRTQLDSELAVLLQNQELENL